MHSHFRIIACPGATKDWAFYVINDSDEAIDRIVLEKFEHEWGVTSDISHPNAEITDLASGADAFLWEENDYEMRMTLYLRVQAAGNERNYAAEFKSLYKRQGEMAAVSGWGKVGLLPICMVCAAN